jgi:hypothetical protein
MTNYTANPANIENLSNNELREIKAFVKGLIAGIKDTHKEPDSVLEDYWHAWDNTIDINIWIDESDPQRYLATLYSVWNNEIDYETFQRLDYLTGDL